MRVPIRISIVLVMLVGMQTANLSAADCDFGCDAACDLSLIHI